ncbi:MAG: GNAT family N-acetyltransferase [Neobacillus sp.]
MTIKLRKVTKENWEECIDLQVREDQKKYIASNLYSIAQVQFLENFEALAIYHNETMVGFTLFGLDEDDHNYWIYRIMIDEKYQGQGYGKTALKEIIQRLKDKADCKEIILGYHPENRGAEKLYISVGFQAKGMAPWGEKLASYTVSC